MEHLITIDSIRSSLEQQGMECPMVGCLGEDIQLEHIPSSISDCAKDVFSCRDCGTSWSVVLYAARIEYVEVGGVTVNQFGDSPLVEKNALSQMPCPKDPVIDGVKEFIKQMRMGSEHKKGEALARLAHLVRMDLNSLPDSQLVEPLTLPSDTM